MTATQIHPSLSLAGSVALLLGGCAASPPATGPVAAARPSESFRSHHAEIVDHLDHIDAMAANLAGQGTEDQRRTMQRVVAFLREHIAPHADDEERVLYPAVERHAGSATRLTEVPIYEHRIVGRWITALEENANRPQPDADAFARDALHLVGLLRAHFEVEEQVLLPVLDRAMSVEQFNREVADRMNR